MLGKQILRCVPTPISWLTHTNFYYVIGLNHFISSDSCYFIKILRINKVAPQPQRIKMCSRVWLCSSWYFVFLARQQQNEQAVAGVVVIFLNVLVCVRIPHLTSMTNAWNMSTNWVFYITFCRVFGSWAMHVQCQFVLFMLRLLFYCACP